MAGMTMCEAFMPKLDDPLAETGSITKPSFSGGR
jgi:hypothetical protein